MKSFSIVISALLICIAGSNRLQAQIPRTLSYQGVLTDNAGQPRPDGSYNFTFRFYTSPTGGTAIWSESKSLPVKSGLFSTTLGDQTPFGAAVKFDQQYWLGIQVGSDPELSPRIALTSVGYSFSSLRADTASVSVASLADTTWRHSGANIYRLDGNLGIGTPNPQGQLHLRGGSGSQMHAIMTTNNDLPELSLSRWHGPGIDAFSNARVGFAEHPGGGGYDLTLSTANGVLGVVNEQMRITYFGNVGIGTPNPQGQLHLRGGSGSQMHAIMTTTNDLPELSLSRWHGPGIDAFSNARVGFAEHPGGGGYDLTLATANGGLGTVNEQMRITYSGNVGIGTTSPTSKLEIIGTTTTKVLAITGGGDLAEPFEISESQPIPKGALVIIDEDNPGQLKLSQQAYDKRVAGVVSGAGGINPGITLTQEGMLEGGQNVALSGRVYALATAANGPIKPGDLLTTSEVPGHAMKATDVSRSHGTIIGKAMSSLENGEGLVLVLVNLQ